MSAPALDARLAAALGFVRADVHADIGSDHARLPVALVRSGRARRAVIVEKTRAPFDVARAAVRAAGLHASIDVRLGDGFAPLAPGEVQSASLTGMGVRTILGILERAGDRQPERLVLQPNDTAAPLRAWARGHGYHLVGEALAPGYWAFPVLSLERRPGDDPAYTDLADGVTPDLALAWGPHLLARRDALLREELERETRRLAGAATWGRAEAARDLALARRALALYG